MNSDWVIAIIFTGLFIYLGLMLYFEHREKMAALEKGIVPPDEDKPAKASTVSLDVSVNGRSLSKHLVRAILTWSLAIGCILIYFILDPSGPGFLMANPVFRNAWMYSGSLLPLSVLFFVWGSAEFILYKLECRLNK